jgi:hypothetical protein
MLFTIALIGIAYGLSYGFKIDFLLMFICLSPILTQFGSNTSASYLIPPYLLFGVLFIFLAQGKIVADLPTEARAQFRRIVQALVWLVMTLCLLLLQHSSKKLTYEVELPVSAMKQDSQSLLYYSQPKLDSIEKFRLDAGLSGAYNGIRIVDFSFWHPGAILYLGAAQYPVSIADETFERTLEIQAEMVIDHLKKRDKFNRSPMIIRTMEVKPLNKCTKLTTHISDENLSNVLGSQGFDPYVKDVSIYKSFPVDITLYPYNIALLVPCVRE